jgi:hypothetical protein
MFWVSTVPTATTSLFEDIDKLPALRCRILVVQRRTSNQHFPLERRAARISTIIRACPVIRLYVRVKRIRPLDAATNELAWPAPDGSQNQIDSKPTIEVTRTI